MYKVYRIEFGDTIDDIIKKSGSTMEELINLNGEFEVIPGNYIVIPNNKNQLFDIYKVKSGDNMFSLSQKYDIDINDLLALNGLNKDDYIYPNQEILVPNSNSKVYITKNDDTIKGIIEKLRINIEDIINQNDKIYLLPDQLIIYKKEENL